MGDQIAELEVMLQGFLDDIVKKFRSLDGKSANVRDEINAFVLQNTFTLVCLYIHVYVHRTFHCISWPLNKFKRMLVIGYRVFGHTHMVCLILMSYNVSRKVHQMAHDVQLLSDFITK